MESYVSMWSREELARLSRSESLRRVGIKKDKVVIQSPICRKCGGSCVEVDLGTTYLQCVDCGHTEEAHYFTNTRFRGRVE